MRRVKHYKIEVMEYEYTHDEKEKILSWFDDKYGLMNYKVVRSGPKVISPGVCDPKLHCMVIHISKY